MRHSGKPSLNMFILVSGRGADMLFFVRIGHKADWNVTGHTSRISERRPKQSDHSSQGNYSDLERCSAPIRVPRLLTGV